MDVNRVTLVGNLARNPEIRGLPSGSTRATFSLATVRREKRYREVVDCHTVVASGKLAVIIGEYLKEGPKVIVEGRLQNGSVAAERLILLGHATEAAALNILTENL